MLGLSAGSPFPGRSLAAYWATPAGLAPSPITTPAFSERADGTALEAKPTGFLSAGWFQMSMVTGDMHYLRDALGVEQLFNLRFDPFEQSDLMQLADGEQRVQVARSKLLDFLMKNPASPEVEDSYLKSFKDRLQAIVQASVGTDAPAPAD